MDIKLPLDCLMEAKAAREAVRESLVKAITLRGPQDDEIAGLLKADELARENLRTALAAYMRCQIPDSTTQHEPEVSP
jgi:hypothetical protein